MKVTTKKHTTETQRHSAKSNVIVFKINIYLARTIVILIYS